MIFGKIFAAMCIIVSMSSGAQRSASLNNDNDVWTFEDSPLYEEEEEERDDPYEPFNRLMFRLNDVLDKAFLTPIATVYRRVTPGSLQTCVSNFVGHFFSPVDAVNFILQGNGEQVIKTVFRFIVNTCFGFFGAFDVAQKMGIEKKSASFGDTLKKWGAKPGPYIVLPLLGPGSARSGLGKLVHFGIDPLTQHLIFNHKKNVRRRWYYLIYGAKTVVSRADLLPFTIELEKISNDMYISTRRAVMSLEGD